MTEPADQTQAMGGAQITEHLRRDEPVVLGGRYELTERIASGGMASVWRAHDDVLARTVAVKLLHDHLAADEAFRERFRREAIAAAKLTHPHVVSLYDTGTDGDRVYLVMEFVEGATLREVMGDLGKLEPGQAAAIGERIARALDYAHERGLVHRDIKPANILIGDDGCVKVADFGIAKAEEHAGDLTKTGMVLGTAAYVAPEQITGATVVDGRADQYALGCMLYEALAGQQPFKGDTAVATAAQRLEASPAPLRSLRPDIPKGLDSIVMRSMSRDPQDRFLSSGALADALSAFADHDTSHTAALPLATLHRAASGRAPAPPPVSWAEEAAAVAAREHTPRSESFLRTEGRWLLAVLVLVGVAAGLIGLGVLTGLLDASQLPGIDQAPGEDTARDDQVPDPQLDVEEIVSFDPAAGDGENDELLDLAIDDDGSTGWRTDTYYNDPDFGGLGKDGVGFYVDLGAAAEITAVDLNIGSTDEGTNLELFAAQEPGEEVTDWESIGSVSEASGKTPVELAEPVAARYVLVFVTAPLPADGGGYRATVDEVTVRGVLTESER